MARSSGYSKHKIFTVVATIVVFGAATVLVHFSVGRHKFKEFCANVDPGMTLEHLDEITESSGYRLIEGIDGPTFIADRHKYYVPRFMSCSLELDDIRTRGKATVISTEFNETSTLNGL